MHRVHYHTIFSDGLLNAVKFNHIAHSLPEFSVLIPIKTCFIPSCQHLESDMRKGLGEEKDFRIECR